MKKLLLVEDDKSLGTTLSERLTKEELRVHWVTELRKARESIDKEKFDLIVLDVGLPDGSGFDLAREVREKSSVPFIFVTAQGAAEDRLRGYEIGAEEYIPKPFHLKELLLRIKHVLENHVQAPQLQVGDVLIDFASRTVSRESQEERLNLKEYMVLKLLVDKSPQALSRDDILNFVWGENEFPTNRTVDNVILRLRQILGDKVGQNIKSVRGVGYQWLAEKQCVVPDNSGVKK